MSAFTIIGLWILQETSYDKFNERFDRIYRIVSKGNISGKVINDATTGGIVANGLKTDFPEVENTVSIFNFQKAMMSKSNGEAIRMNAMGSTSSIFKIFTLPVIQGEIKSLDEPNTGFISEKTAKKFFGSQNPIGQILSTGMDYEIKKFKIVGIFKDIPENSHIKFDFLFSLSSCSFYRNSGEDWLNSGYHTYVLLEKNVNYKEFENKLKRYTQIKITPIIKGWKNLTFQEWVKSGQSFELLLQPLTSIHLHSSLKNELSQNGDITYVYMSLIIGLFILIISIVNFTNLSTVNSLARTKEIGIKKVSGATRKTLIEQFLTESCLFSLLATILSIVLVQIIIPLFNHFTEITISNNLIFHWKILAGMIPFLIIIGIIAGLYPAFVISKFSPVKVLSSNSKIKFSSLLFKDLLLIFQFIITIAVIIGTIVVTRQLDFLQNQKLGFNKDNILIIRQTEEMNPDQQKLFKENLLKNNSVISASYSHRIPSMDIDSRNYAMLTKNELKQCMLEIFPCDQAFFDIYKFELLSGSLFSEKLLDNPRKIIINEQAVKEYNITNAIGNRLYINSKDYYEIIGIVKNFHYNSKRKEIQPAGFVQEPDREMFWSPEFLSLRINGRSTEETVKYAKKQWESALPGKEFIYSFFDKDYDALYKSEAQTKRLFYIFSFIAICLSCFGLFSIVNSVILNRTKEIGIRKVNGAKTFNIILLVSNNYSKWVAIASIISCPIAWYIMHKWLQNFAYKTALSWWIFLVAGLIVLIITVLTVIVQSYKAATRNPVESLRYE